MAIAFQALPVAGNLVEVSAETPPISTARWLGHVLNLGSWERLAMRKHKGHVRKHTGFTLVELVVVVMILGILAAVAAPKLLSTSGTATDNALKQTLAVVRDAIERYAAENNGQLPPGGTEAAFKGAIEPLLRGDFPVCPIGDSAAVAFSADDPLAVVGTTGGWIYSTASGEFAVNSTAASSDGTSYDSF